MAENQTQEFDGGASAAFNFALNTGQLSHDQDSYFYVGAFMFMGTEGGTHLFKRIDSRKYYRIPCGTA